MTSPAAPRFDATVAFAEFERALRDNYAYLERTDFDVDAHLATVRRAAEHADSPAGLRRLLQRSTFAFTDPHLMVGPLDDQDFNVWPTSADLSVTSDENGYFVQDVRADSPADHIGIRPGWRVTTIDETPLDSAVSSAWFGAASGPTRRQRDYLATIIVNGTRATDRSIGFVVNGVAQRTRFPNAREFARSFDQEPPVAATREGDTLIVRFNNSLGRDETIAAFDAVVAANVDVRTVILDFRNTPSGGSTNVARAIMGHFITQERPYQIHEVPGVLRRTSVPHRSVAHVVPRPPVLQVRVIAIGGRWTGSMGEGLVIGLNGAAQATTFASNMGDLLGALDNVDLINTSAVLSLGAESLFHVNGTPRADYVADHPLETADRDSSGGDPAMLAIRAWLRAQP